MSFIHCNASVTLTDTLGYSGYAHAGVHEIIPISIATSVGFVVRSGLMYTTGPIVMVSALAVWSFHLQCIVVMY